MFCAPLNRFVQHKSCTLGMYELLPATPYRSNAPTWFAVKADDIPGPNCPACCHDKLTPTWCEMRAQVSLTHLYTQKQFDEIWNLEVEMNECTVPYLTILIKLNWTVKRTERLMMIHNNNREKKQMHCWRWVILGHDDTQERMMLTWVSIQQCGPLVLHMSVLALLWRKMMHFISQSLLLQFK